jgi:hypothetical protein
MSSGDAFKTSKITNVRIYVEEEIAPYKFSSFFGKLLYVGGL